jgi:hypothetical protein
MTVTYAGNLSATTGANKFPTVGGVVTTEATGVVSGLALPAAKLGIEKLANVVPVITNAGAPTAASQTPDETNTKGVSTPVLTGVTGLNSDAGKLYYTVVSDGSSKFHVEFFTDAAHTAANKVAHSASVLAEATGVAITADNSSGIGGTMVMAAAAEASTAATNIVTVVHATGHAICPKGSLLVDTTNGLLYINTGTLDVPVWTKVGTQS